MAVDDDPETVGIIQPRIAAGIGDDDAIRVVIVGDNADVQRIVCKTDKHLGPLRRCLPLNRLDLPETTGRNNTVPCRVVKYIAINLRGSMQRRCLHDRALRRRRLRDRSGRNANCNTACCNL